MLPLLGKHNAQNALAACLALHFAFDVPLQCLADALATFRGSKRRQELLGAPAGAASDLVLLAPVARAELPAEQQLDTERLARDLTAGGVPSVACCSIDEVRAHILEATRAGDAVALLSNGTFGGIHAALLGALSARISQH